VRSLLAQTNLPVVCTYQGAGVVPHEHFDCFGGRVGLFHNQPADKLLDAADVVIAIGYDPVEYEPGLWNKGSRRNLIHIDAVRADLDKDYRPQIELTGDIAAVPLAASLQADSMLANCLALTATVAVAMLVTGAVGYAFERVIVQPVYGQIQTGDLKAIGEAITDKKVVIGVIDHHTLQVERPDQVAVLIREALKHIPAQRLMISSDCGMGREGMGRRHAAYKMVAMVLGTNIVRKELGLPQAECLAAEQRFSLIGKA
jgi:TPP-dependent 2-oxoacid decarboxylase